jgi:hypothetical protein
MLAAPTFGTIGWTDLTRPALATELRHVRGVVSGRVGEVWHEARAQLAFLATPREELADLELGEVLRASAGWSAMTVTGAEAA